MNMVLGLPASYFPIARGTYDVLPGLRGLGTAYGNGKLDSCVFQIDSEFARFRINKLACRADRLEKYFQVSELSPAAEGALIVFLTERFAFEYPEHFSWREGGLDCRLTGERICVDSDNQLLSSSVLAADYRSAFDALACQVAEDICLMRFDGTRDCLAAAHVCSPGHWSAEQKIGRPFTAIHEPVPGIEPITNNAKQFVEMMVQRGPFVRFAWGVGTDDRLNHHPEPPTGVEEAVWRGRRFDAANPAFFLRVERQVMWGLPAAGAAVFVIRVSHLSSKEIRANAGQRDQLISALQSMSAESRKYKGVEDSVDAIVDWLSKGNA